VPDLAAALAQHLSRERVALLRAAGAMAVRSRVSLYLVGGCVRDLLLGRPVLDLDLVAEGDASALGDSLAAELGGQVTARSQFGTVKLRVGETILDLATSRTETYAQPGALPTVKPGPLAADLKRRDFSINAMAAHLSPERFGELVDPFGGYDDLLAKTVRVLHRMSFMDDATRILRGIRYEARLGFLMDVGTEALARRDARYLETISPDRLRHELDRVLHEPEPERCLARAREMGVLAAILPALTWPARLHQEAGALREADRTALLTPNAFLGLLAWPLAPDDASALARRLNLGAKQLGVVEDTRRLASLLPALTAPALRPSEAYALLKDLDPDAVHAAFIAAVDAPVARGRLDAFVQRWRDCRPHLTAYRLLALGVPQGPLVGEFLRRLLAHRLDHPEVAASDEEAMVRRWLTERPQTPPKG